MRRIGHIFNRIIRWLGCYPKSRTNDIPKKLTPEALAAVMREAQFLRGQHGVEVRALAPGEVPDIPKSADGSAP